MKMKKGTFKAVNLPILDELFNPLSMSGALAFCIFGFEVDATEEAEKTIAALIAGVAAVLTAIASYILTHPELWLAIWEFLAANWLPVLLAVAQVFIVALVIWLIYSLWKDTDLIALGTVALSDLQPFHLTYPTNALPGEDFYVLADAIEVTRTPLTKNIYSFEERRRCKSRDERSTYDLILEYERVT